MKQVVPLPIDARRHHIEGEPAASVGERDDQQLLPVSEHPVERNRTTVVENAVQHDVVIIQQRAIVGQDIHLQERAGRSAGARSREIPGRDVEPRVVYVRPAGLRLDDITQMAEPAPEIEKRDRFRGVPNHAEHERIPFRGLGGGLGITVSQVAVTVTLKIVLTRDRDNLLRQPRVGGAVVCHGGLGRIVARAS